MAIQVRARRDLLRGIDANSKKRRAILMVARQRRVGAAFEKLKGHLIGKGNEEPSWLFLFLLSSAVSAVVGIIVKLIELFVG